jgi:hypothetical protein
MPKELLEALKTVEEQTSLNIAKGVVRSPKDCCRTDKFKYAKGVVRSPKDCCRTDNTMVKRKEQKIS